MSADVSAAPPKEPLTAPLPMDSPASNRVSPNRSPIHTRGNSTPNLGEPISPGPSSAPSSFTWSEKEDESDPGKFGRFNLDSLVAPKQPQPEFPASFSFSRSPPSPEAAPLCAGRVITPAGIETPAFSRVRPAWALAPADIETPTFAGLRTTRAIAPADIETAFGSKPGALGFASLNLSPPPKPVAKPEPTPDRAVAVLPSFPDDAALMSPRAETMTDNPIHHSFSELSGCKGDPRSPPTKGESPIVRSIDDMI
ncbi:hypothetical protein NEMBOFW57_000465 [Staphylotrichum longicolle]|uniref:Uncharacterized protein n=1 Tax=Staphylotrichum longicolle TaxID=669026 RepID=A0AAD4I2Y5_9PEZI|nr:hypothetical protein NEMBOFW57_000465 [Staphylotrichum longicolle]